MFVVVYIDQLRPRKLLLMRNFSPCHLVSCRETVYSIAIRHFQQDRRREVGLSPLALEIRLALEKLSMSKTSKATPEPAATVTQFIRPDKAYTDEGDEKLKHGVPGAGRDGVENEKQRGM